MILETSPDKCKALLWHWGQTGAGSKFTYELARALRNVSGICLAVSMAEGSDLNQLVDALENVPVHIIQTFRGSKSSIAGKISAFRAIFRIPVVTRTFRQSLNETDADVAICTMQSIWDVAAIIALRRSRSRFVLILHDAVFHPGDGYPFRQRILNRQINMADGLIVLSEHVAQSAQKLHGFPSDRIWVVPHGAFAFGEGTPAPRAYPEGRPFRLLFFGRIVVYKGLGHLLAAYRLLRERGIDVEIDIVGSGDMSPYVEALKGLQGVSINNTWVTEQEISDALAKADAVVLPYIEASQSGVAASALTAGLPIIGTPIGGLKEQIQDGKTGIIAKGMEVSDLADAIQTLVNNPSLYEACSESAVEFAREELGWAAIAQKVGNIAREVSSLPRRRTL